MYFHRVYVVSTVKVEQDEYKALMVNLNALQGQRRGLIVFPDSHPALFILAQLALQKHRFPPFNLLHVDPNSASLPPSAPRLLVINMLPRRHGSPRRGRRRGRDGEGNSKPPPFNA